MTDIYGKRQEDLLAAITFTKDEDAKILQLLKNNWGAKYIAKKLNRPLHEVECHIFVKPSLRCMARKFKDHAKIAERFKLAEAIVDNKRGGL
jgi:hypothetical protein